MVFSSPVFLFIFLPAVFILNLLLPKKFKNLLLLLESLFFYAWGEPVFVIVMLASILANYFLALGIDSCAGRKGKRLVLVSAIVFNLSLLAVFKYANFIVDNICAITGIDVGISGIPLPIGISFFTFQALSYVIDVYRDRTCARKKLTHVALYISYFPQLIAGPIVRYHDIAEQIEQRTETVGKMAAGLRRFSVGLGKKILIANAVGRIADTVFAMDMPGCTSLEAWVGAVTYTLQIYFDFSGYSDMAIGLGGMFGFKIRENFNYPFVARSIRDFWRRWHISLSRWFKDYLYIPLGGNRKGAGRTYLNLSVVFFLTGLWHGAEWTFVLWGLFHGFFMVLERAGFFKPERIKPRLLSNLYALTVVVSGFVIFRSESLNQAGLMFKAMFAEFSFYFSDAAFTGLLLSPVNFVVLAAALLASTPLISHIRVKVSGYDKLSAVVNATGYFVSFAILFLSLLVMSSSTYNPFIYFRF